MRKVKHLDIQKQDDKIVCSIQWDDGTCSLTYTKDDKDNFLRFFWNQIQVESTKGNFEKAGGSWR